MVSGEIAMKKIISFLILFVFIAILICGCSHKTYTDSNKSMFQNKFVVIREDKGPDDYIYLIYDKYTKVVYLYTIDGYRGGLTPYYIVVDGEPTIAIYGVNYEYQE